MNMLSRGETDNSSLKKWQNKHLKEINLNLTVQKYSFAIKNDHLEPKLNWNEKTKLKKFDSEIDFDMGSNVGTDNSTWEK